MDKLTSLCKRRGFVFQSSSIYGGLSGSWDYGPLGTELKRNIKEAWWQAMTREEDNIFGLDAAIMMNPKTWEASGHVDSFADPMIDDKVSKTRYRVDHLIEGHIDSLQKKGKTDNAERVQNAYQKALNQEPVTEALYNMIINEKIKSPDSGAFDWTKVREFNLMFQTELGAIADSSSIIYLRPETAQGIFVNFHPVREASRAKIPFGIAQIGKAFRNEIIKGNFVFRQIEFEQMEMQYFIKPGTQKDYFKQWQEKRFNWYLDALGMTPENLSWHEHDKLAHYADSAYDIEFKFPFGTGEIEGVHSRTDFDLSRHQDLSGKNMRYHDTETNEKFVPYVIETSAGCDRVFLAILCDAYQEDTVEGEKRVFLKFDPKIAPIKAAVLPLMKKDGMPELALKLKKRIQKDYVVQYDESGSIGRRYRRQDEIGTPFCFTIDHDSLNDQTVTVRKRDSTSQQRIAMDSVVSFLHKRI